MDNRPEKPDRQLEEKLKKEIPYIIGQALKELKKLFEDNALYESERSRELVSELYADSDSVQAFIQERMIRDISKSIKSTELHKSYKKYCEETEREPLSRTRFFSNLKNKGFGKKIVHGHEYFVGLAEKDNDFIEVDDSQELPFE